MLQNYVIHCQPSILKNAITLQTKKKEEIDKNYDPTNLFLKGLKQDKWYKIHKERKKSQPEETIAERIKADDEDLCNMPPLEGDEEEVKLKPEETIAEKVKLNP